MKIHLTFHLSFERESPCSRSSCRLDIHREMYEQHDNLYWPLPSIHFTLSWLHYGNSLDVNESLRTKSRQWRQIDFDHQWLLESLFLNYYKSFSSKSFTSLSQTFFASEHWNFAISPFRNRRAAAASISPRFNMLRAQQHVRESERVR